MTTLKTTLLQQSAIQDNVRSAGLIKFSSGILIFVMMSALAPYLIGNVVLTPEGLPSLFLVLLLCSLPLLYATAGFVELVSGESSSDLPRRWKKYTIAQRRFLVVIISLMSLIAIALMTLGIIPPYLPIF